MNVLCVIPARSGSKGIPNKNITLLGGKPLIAYSIMAAKQSTFNPRVVVSTDSENYKRICKKYGAEVPFLRPTELSKDNVHSVYTVIHLLNWLKENEEYWPDVAVMLLPTAPLRQTRHIDEAITLYLQNRQGSVISVNETKAPYYIRQISNGCLQPILEAPKNRQRQNFSHYYSLNGAIYVSSPDFIVQHETFHYNPVFPYIMESEYSIDIDKKADLNIAEALINSSVEKGIMKKLEHFSKTTELLSQQFRDGLFNRLDIFVRYLAIEELYGLNKIGISIYKKMQKKRACGKRVHAVEPVFQDESILKEIVEAIEINGFDERSKIVIDQNMHLIDGSHRLACALFFDIEKIPVEIIFTRQPVYYSKRWFEENGFTKTELNLIEKKRVELFKKLGLYFFVIIWPPALDFFEEITQDIASEYKILFSHDCLYENSCELKSFAKGVYSIDDVEDWKVNEKINFMLSFPPKIRVLGVEIKEPSFNFKNNGTPASLTVEKIKNKITNKYKNQMPSYYHNLIIHIGDNYEHTKTLEKLFFREIKIAEYLESIKNYNYAIDRKNIPYMPSEFPNDFPLEMNLNILCSEKDFLNICNKAKEFALKYNEHYEIKTIYDEKNYFVKFELLSESGENKFLCLKLDISVFPEEDSLL